MFVSSLIALGLAITSICVSAKIPNQILQLLAISIALICLILSFIFSPVPIEVLIVIALLITTRQIHTLNHNTTTTAVCNWVRYIKK